MERSVESDSELGLKHNDVPLVLGSKPNFHTNLRRLKSVPCDGDYSGNYSHSKTPPMGDVVDVTGDVFVQRQARLCMYTQCRSSVLRVRKQD